MKIEVAINTRGIDIATLNLERIDKIVRNMAYHVEADAKASMEGPKSGRLYKRGKTKRGRAKIHRASAPGEAPAVDTGNLKNNIKTRQTGKMTYEVYVAQKAIRYAIPLELGSPRRKLAPRPFLRPALDRIRKPFQKAIEREIFGGLF